ncbi:MAG: hypothetical protein M3442_22180 [Chloroflexota bacterium]|nr:hypothetical protein [Chloroflexota bacterium]
MRNFGTVLTATYPLTVTEMLPRGKAQHARVRTVFGPQECRLNRIGVTPDILVTPTPEDEAAGHDPQLAAALEILRR